MRKEFKFVFKFQEIKHIIKQAVYQLQDKILSRVILMDITQRIGTTLEQRN